MVDNTNREPRARKEWITIAKEKVSTVCTCVYAQHLPTKILTDMLLHFRQNLPIRCFEMDVPKPLSMHLNTFRSLTEQKKIPDVAIHGFYKNLVPPTVSGWRATQK